MASVIDICISLSNLVKTIGEAAWELDDHCGLLDEARKLHRYLRRVEAVITDIKPYLRGVRVWGSLREIEGVFSSLLHVLLETGEKGPLVQYLQADRVLGRFTAATTYLHAALGHLQVEACRPQCTASPPVSVSSSGPAALAVAVAVPAETLAELCVVRELLQRAAFKLPAGHIANLERFRKACDGLNVHFRIMLTSYSEMMKHTRQDSLLSKEAFCAIINELQTEVEVLQQQMLRAAQLPCSRSSCDQSFGFVEYETTKCFGQAAQQHGHSQPELDKARHNAAEQHYLRMLMDVVRASQVNTDSEAPLDFLCPLTHQLMQDPVLLHETGHSYERKALEEWWSTGHRFCPRTGLHLRRLNISPNHNLRSAIERWRLHSDLHLSFKPVLSTLSSQRQEMQHLNQHQKVASCSQCDARTPRQVPSARYVQDFVPSVQVGQRENKASRTTPSCCPAHGPSTWDESCSGAAPTRHPQPQQPREQAVRRQDGSTTSLDGAQASGFTATDGDSCGVPDVSDTAREVCLTESGATSRCAEDASVRVSPSPYSSSQELGLSRFASWDCDSRDINAPGSAVPDSAMVCSATDTCINGEATGACAGTIGEPDSKMTSCMPCNCGVSS
ncbi:hypothetical protein VOLCADRAFT_119489 [Volvox carteri f. nagariensis]|uniref:U-box domain-containing protein n=1 Tax=Volvox carteri f. nagariensis TaxID=3068 RepID=D8UDE3_VOLCA|nr:uncharacterized protein VOLCADRAFT_119489 [Volvox carteri f. nagariensis]EFJ42249.1 hypothetical protein VOLCADRAFT_119489 [Volvox carteri f. nagariensis]|eukprot:XP_002956647.1 hypothetical protein VOLCADRAFT_119489 [Volvox carteri f. nagariensis]